MLINPGMMSSTTDDWSTPRGFFATLDEEFHFDLDVCASVDNAKCPKFYTREDDGLSRPWEGVCYCNPPYGRTIARWMQKAYESSCQGTTVVCLVPARTDSDWWHRYAMKGEIRFVRGRLKFGGGKDTAPFPSALVIFRPHQGSSIGVQKTFGF